MAQELVPFISLDKDGKEIDHSPIYVDTKTGILYYVKKHQGRLIKFTTHRTREQLNAAKRYINEELPARLGRKKSRKAVPFNRDELPLFVAMKESEGHDEGTLAVIRRTVENKIMPYWGDKLVSEINNESVIDSINWYKQAFPGEGKFNYIKYLRNYFGYLHSKQSGGLPLLVSIPKIKDPDAKAVRAARIKKTKRILTSEEFKQIYEAGNDQQKLACLFMYTMATRIEETCSLRFGEEILLHTDPPLYRWSIGQNKADHEGEHALHPSLIEPLRALAKIRKAEGTSYVFPQVRDNQVPIKPQQLGIEGLRALVGLGWNWSSKTFRHTCLSTLFADETIPQALILKLYRVSLRVALDAYVKPTQSGILKMQNAIKVEL